MLTLRGWQQFDRVTRPTCHGKFAMPEWQATITNGRTRTRIKKGHVQQKGSEDDLMNWDQIEGKWKQLKGSAKARWSQLTDSDFDSIDGEREQLVGIVQERYGIAREMAEKQVDDWGESLRLTSARLDTTPRRKAG